MDAIIELVHKLSAHQKAEVIRSLSQLELESDPKSDGTGDTAS